jgi:hypothetical protein
MYSSANDPINISPTNEDQIELQDFIKDTIESYLVVESDGSCFLSELGEECLKDLFNSCGYNESDYDTVPKFLEVFSAQTVQEARELSRQKALQPLSPDASEIDKLKYMMHKSFDDVIHRGYPMSYHLLFRKRFKSAVRRERLRIIDGK